MWSFAPHSDSESNTNPADNVGTDKGKSSTLVIAIGVTVGALGLILIAVTVFVVIFYRKSLRLRTGDELAPQSSIELPSIRQSNQSSDYYNNTSNNNNSAISIP